MTEMFTSLQGHIVFTHLSDSPGRFDNAALESNITAASATLKIIFKERHGAQTSTKLRYPYNTCTR
jgi:hypothetical protein